MRRCLPKWRNFQIIAIESTTRDCLTTIVEQSLFLRAVLGLVSISYEQVI